MLSKKVKLLLLILCIFLSTAFFPSLSTPQERTLTKEQQTRVFSEADSILKQLGEMRGFELRQPVQKNFKSRAQLRELLIRYSHETKNREKLDADRKTMVKFGLIPKDFPYTQFALELLTEQIAGFYHFRTQSLNLLDSTPVAMQMPVLAHELSHALQDQNFELKRFMEPVPDDDDKTEAHQALVEGEATALMLEFLLKPLGQSLSGVNLDVKALIERTNQMGTEQMKSFRDAPRALQTTLMAPYVYGTAFFQFFRLHNDWPRASAIFRDPPHSMEQMMHPEKYFDHRDDPIRIAIPPLPTSFGRRWKVVDTNVLGEMGTLIVLQQFLNDNNSKIASEGGGGDQYQVLENDSGQLLLLLVTCWDTEDDATQFFNSYRVLLEKKYKRLKMITAEDRHRIHWNSEEGRIFLGINGQGVSVLEGASESDLEMLRETLSRSRFEPARLIISATLAPVQ